MCGIFGGVGISKSEAAKGIDLINRGNDGISISQLEENLIFAARRHLVKNLELTAQKHLINHIFQKIKNCSDF